ncbi:importin-alpha export receptor [Paramarasmius palmivorus]|uniref:Importin-alpha export receptor n=1 Tax=Paramarasmius palmivorus TaxID=297713 RepID=A0AAW0AYS5_9AGAR
MDPDACSWHPWHPDELRNSHPSGPTPLPSQLKRGTLEVVELFVKLYTEKLLESNAVPAFLQGVRSLVGSNRLTNKTGQSSSTIAACTSNAPTFGPSDKGIRAQVAESVALIAELDFPSKWPDLIDQLVGSLQTSESNTILGVLHTAHSIFRQWRAHVRSDQLFTEINLDIPPAIEDTHKEFFAGESGWFPMLMAWDPNDLRNNDPDEPTPSLRSAQVTTLSYSLRQKLFLPWLKASSVRCLSPSNEARALRMTAWNSSVGLSIGACKRAGRQAADVVKALVGTGGGEVEKITIASSELDRAKALPSTSSGMSTVGEGWKAKIAHSTSPLPASRGASAQHGVTATNALVDVVMFFSDFVYED